MASSDSQPVPLTNWISMPAILVTVPTVTQNSLHPLSTSSIIACDFLDFMVQKKITEAKAPTELIDNPSGRHPIRTIGTPTPIIHSPIFMPNALSATTLPICLGLGQAPNNATLHTQWLGSYYFAHVFFFQGK